VSQQPPPRSRNPREESQSAQQEEVSPWDGLPPRLRRHYERDLKRLRALGLPKLAVEPSEYPSPEIPASDRTP
jgi:hypothetical protein